MRVVGYGFLHRDLGLNVFGPRLPAHTSAVLRVLEQADHLAIPEGVAPALDASHLDHILFALKHEGVDLQILSGALRAVPPETMIDAITNSPGGIYIRKACYLWEHFNKAELQFNGVTGASVGLFDPEQYVTVEGAYASKWRVRFNGIGTLDYCPIIRRTAGVDQLFKGDLFHRIDLLVKSTEPALLDRAMSWAYLGETDGSFAIEGETASPGKRERFANLLRRAHEASPITEGYLVELQNATLEDSVDLAVSFRTGQNRLVNGRTVTYMPPPADLCGELMGHLMRLSNLAPQEMDPIAAAAISSFGFVFLHPFMDGNGRISRFLFHKALCDSGKLPKGLLLPVSVAMKKHEADYLRALQSFSRPARQLWTVGNLGDGQYTEDFNGTDAIYRYWDATECVEFGFAMAEEALEKHLSHEVTALMVYDQVKAAIDEDFDIRGDKLSTLIFACMENDGRVSKNIRKKFADLKPGLLDRVEELVNQHMPRPEPVAAAQATSPTP